MAVTASKRATCPRRAVGAVLVSPSNCLIGTGYNGAPRKLPHCTDAGCTIQQVNGRDSCQRAVHAELNAVINAGRKGDSTIGSTLYVTAFPCLRCSLLIVQAGISEVWSMDDYPDHGEDILTEAGILLHRYTGA